jgi:hypothetical protein
MDRNESVPETYRFGDRIGSRLGQEKAAFQTCGYRTMIFEASDLSLLRCVNAKVKPTFSHP